MDRGEVYTGNQMPHGHSTCGVQYQTYCLNPDDAANRWSNGRLARCQTDPVEKSMRLQLLPENLQKVFCFLLQGRIKSGFLTSLSRRQSENSLFESFKTHLMERQLQFLLEEMERQTELIKQQTKEIEMHDEQQEKRYRKMSEMMEQTYLSQRRHEGVTLLSLREEFQPTSSSQPGSTDEK